MFIDFSLREWKRARKIWRTDNLTKYDSHQLLDDLGIQKYLKPDECKVHTNIQKDPQGWNIHSSELYPNFNDLGILHSWLNIGTNK